MAKKKGGSKGKTLLAAVLLLGAGAAGAYFGLPWLQSVRQPNQAEQTEPAPVVFQAEAAVSSITDTISGTGVLSREEAEDIVVPVGITIDEVLVESGDRVEEGQVLATVDATSVATAIRDIQQSIDKVDGELEDLSEDSETVTVTAPVSGRVKGLKISSGDDAADVMRENGSLLILSADGKMAVSVTSEDRPEGLATGEEVSVTMEDGDVYTGTVDQVIGSRCVVLISDKGSSVGEEVSVAREDGAVLGRGELYVHQPLTITATSGDVSKVYVSENEKVDQGDRLFKLKNVVDIAKKNELLAKRQDLTDALSEMLEIQKTGQIISDKSGVVDAVNLKDKTEVTKGMTGTSSGITSPGGSSSDLSIYGMSARGRSARKSVSLMSAVVSVRPLSGDGTAAQDIVTGKKNKKKETTQEETKKKKKSGKKETEESSEKKKSKKKETESSEKEETESSEKKKSKKKETEEETETTKSGPEPTEPATKEEPEPSEPTEPATKEEPEPTEPTEPVTREEPDEPPTPSESGEIIFGGEILELPITPPVAGDAPMELEALQEAVEKLLKKKEKKYTVKDLGWSTDGYFESGKIYTAYVTVTFEGNDVYEYVNRKGDFLIRADGCISYEYTYTEDRNQLIAAITYLTLEAETSQEPSGEETSQEESSEEPPTEEPESSEEESASVPETSSEESSSQEETSWEYPSPSDESSFTFPESSFTFPESSFTFPMPTTRKGGGFTIGDYSGTGSGSPVINSSGSSLYSSYETVGFTVSANDNMILIINVNELDILSVKVGQSVAVTLDAMEGETFEGEVAEISETGSNNGGVTKYPVKITIPRNENMMVGMSATATVTVSLAEDVLTIPAAALQERGARTFVYTSEAEGELSGETEVTTGHSDGNIVEIVSGLAEGQTVYYSQMPGVSIGDSQETFAFQAGGGYGGNRPSGGNFGDNRSSGRNFGGSGGERSGSGQGE